MRKADLEEYVQQGIHGPKEIKPDERRRYLSTLRERVIVALTKVQVKRDTVYKEVEELIKKNGEAHLFLNGNLEYSDLSKYIQIAKDAGVDFTMVSNKDYDSELGLVLAMDHAIDRENIYVQDKPSFVVKKKSKGIGSFLGSIFKK